MISLIIDSITNTTKSDHDGSSSPTNSTNASSWAHIPFEQDEEDPWSSSRRLTPETSAEFTPSIIFMVLTLLIFLPRILSNVFYVLVNIFQGISLNHSVKVISLMLVAVPFAILVSVLAGASRWTYVSLLLLFMHSAYALYNSQRRKVDPRLTDLSLLSCRDWRNYRLQENATYLPDILSTLVGFQELFREETKRLKATSFFFVVAKVLWPTLDKAYFRWNARSVILESCMLDSATLQKKYGVRRREALPVATLVYVVANEPSEGCKGTESMAIPHGDRL